MGTATNEEDPDVAARYFERNASSDPVEEVHAAEGGDEGCGRKLIVTTAMRASIVRPSWPGVSMIFV
jgi:hypothetical protein